MRGGGEYGELTIELAASLAAHKTPVTPEERDELRALLEAMNMPTDPIGQLNVAGLAVRHHGLGAQRPNRPGRHGPDSRCVIVGFWRACQPIRGHGAREGLWTLPS